MWIVFEGLDKSGKGTLELELLKATNFKHIIIDRGPAGYLVFDKIFNRTTPTGDRDFIDKAYQMMSASNCFVIYCRASEDVALKRISENSEECPYNYSYAQGLYDLAVDFMYNEDKVLILDTSKDSIDECIKSILCRLKELKEQEVLSR